ncbi:DNAJ domain-containing protein [Cryptosporidium canis]|uniref:DNAJ domain-containing protein n=1 Tax=Cryptosporidium canis TaxID=195482 RepID=A0ABQ8PBJ6_9CRYT|nr:DNAJ domain-containing protein [Cryptosporidium canis]KAJ1615152.1 DNAJ domain-containing protein [Cryptosporidium canis]
MELIKRSIIALSKDSTIKNYNYDKYIFYSIQYANNFGENCEPENYNIVQSENKMSYTTISLKQIKEIIPKYKFCCCYSNTCTCNFIVRYKSRDDRGIYQWIWRDLMTDQDVAIPYNSKIILKILVFLGYSSPNDSDFHVENATLKYKKSEDNIEPLEPIEINYFYDKTSSINKKDKFQKFSSYNVKQVISNPKLDTINNNEIKCKDNVGGCSNSAKLGSVIDRFTEDRINIGYDDLVEEIGRWSRKHDGSYKDIRVLLSSLHQVLWESAHWEQVEFSKLMSDVELVKKMYRKALVLCHPDKHHKENEKHKCRVHLIFTAINEAHNKYNAS